MAIHDQNLLQIVLILSVSLWSGMLAAGDWPHWQGPNRNDTVTETSGWISGEWLETVPQWTKNLGEGSTSPIIVGDRLFVMGWRDGEDHLHCLQAGSGELNWSVSYQCPKYGRVATGDEGLYSGPTSTPEYDTQTGFLYTLSCNGNLICWDTSKRGQRIWSVDLYEQYSVARRPKVGRSGLRDYGYTTAPFLFGDVIIVEVGSDKGTLVAFQKSTGKQVWLSEARGPAGHTGGVVPMVVEGIPCVAVMSFSGLLVARLDAGHEGETVAEYEWITEFINNIATPAVFENYVLITSAYNHDAICKLEITLQGAKVVWEQPYCSKVCTPIIYKGHVYLAWKKLRCLDFETGEQKWEGGQFGDAGSCIITGDERIIVWGGSGRLVLAESAARSPHDYKALATIDKVFSTDVWPHVAISSGRVFCKDRLGNLACFTIKQ